ncbi:MAG: alpha/beta hydrolase [Gammaproteobacteria bacterium]|nr:alpha/beta hydrolase [Gammaproteobacteria bacterium]
MMFNWKRILLNGVLRLLVRRRFKNSYTVEFIRRLIAKLDRPVKLPKGMDHRFETIENLACEWYLPAGLDDDAPLMLYFPGGGFVLPAMNAHRDMVVDLCEKNGCRGLLAQYRLGPEHMMPTGQYDGLAMYRHLLEQRGERADNIFIAGDSAGGGIALSTLLQARDAQLPLPLGAMLLSPGTDMTMSGNSLLDNLNKDPLFHISALLWMLKHSLPNTMPSNDPLVSPALGDFTGLPPLLLEVGSTEMLLDHSTLVADAARAKGLDVTLTISPHSPHVYPIMGFLPEGKAARARMGHFMRRLRMPQPQAETVAQQQNTNQPDDKARNAA